MLIRKSKPSDVRGPNKRPKLAIYKLVFISKYRDNSILRDEVVAN